MATGPKILLVDDDADLRRLLSLRLVAAGYGVEVAGSGVEALGRLDDFQPDVILTDVRMSGMDGMQLFDVVRRRMPSVPVVVLTAHGTIPAAVDATRRGVFGYLTKPFDARVLLACLADAARHGGGAPVGDDEAWRAQIVTRSARMDDLLRRARRVAASDASVLLLGESGTGKELLARALHRASRRGERAFVGVNCAAIPETLLESELFGHRRGAFTGASTDHVGLFEAAAGGTIFLDEIGDMPAALQVKLLRVLQEREIRPVGATRAVALDVRVISATHGDLEREAEAGRFRIDLLYRLNVVTLQLPALGERPEDVPLLARRFLDELAVRDARGPMSFAPEAVTALVEARWPGNVRQLRNVVERCVALSPGTVVTTDLVAEALRDGRATFPRLQEARSDAEREYLVRVLQITRGNVTHAARVAGRNRTELYKLLARHALDPGRYRDE